MPPLLAFNRLLDLCRNGLYALALLALSAGTEAQVAVTTQHNDNKRTGQTLHETLLNTSNVNVKTFGKLFSRTADGQIYAQPLYVPHLLFDNLSHNVVCVARSCPQNDLRRGQNQNRYGHLLISSPCSRPDYWAEKLAGPALIKGRLPGTGAGSVNGYVYFQAIYQNNRPGLLLMNGSVYVGFGSTFFRSAPSGNPFEAPTSPLRIVGSAARFFRTIMTRTDGADLWH